MENHASGLDAVKNSFVTHADTSGFDPSLRKFYLNAMAFVRLVVYVDVFYEGRRTAMCFLLWHVSTFFDCIFCRPIVCHPLGLLMEIKHSAFFLPRLFACLS